MKICFENVPGSKGLKKQRLDRLSLIGCRVCVRRWKRERGGGQARSVTQSTNWVKTEQQLSPSLSLGDGFVLCVRRHMVAVRTYIVIHECLLLLGRDVCVSLKNVSLAPVLSKPFIFKPSSLFNNSFSIFFFKSIIFTTIIYD